MGERDRIDPGYFPADLFRRPHRARAAVRAISRRFADDSFLARALPPRLANSAAYAFSFRLFFLALSLMLVGALASSKHNALDRALCLLVCIVLRSRRQAMRAIGYARVSTEDQAREGVSLDAQEARIPAFCEAKGWELVAVLRDEGRSAKDLNRPGLQQILGGLAKRQRCFDALVVVKLDRLTRSVKDLATLMQAFRRARGGFTAIQEAVDTTSATGELFYNIVASISQWERRVIGERTAAALAHLRARGRRVSRWAPYGFKFGPGGNLAPDERGRGGAARLAALRASRPPLRAISRRLAKEGILARSGKPFSPSTLALLVHKGSLVDRNIAS